MRRRRERPKSRRLELSGPILRANARRRDIAKTVAGAIVVATIVGCSLSLTIALLAVRLDVAGYSARAIGFNTAAGGVATLCGAPFIPILARWFGVAQLLLASLILGGVALIGFTLTDSYTAWLALRFLLGFVVTIEFVLSEYWITTWAPAHRSGMAIGVYAMSLAVGFAVGPLLLTIVGTSGNEPFYIGAAMFFGAAIPLALNARHAPPLEMRSTKTLFTFLREAPAATLAALLHGAIEVAGLSLLPVYALRSGASVADGALFASLFVLGNSALQLPLGIVADRFDRRKLLLILAAIGLVGAALLGLIGVANLLLFEGILLIWGGMVGGLYPVGLSQLGATYREADLAAANSAFVMAYAIGMLGGPPLIGLGIDLIPPSGFFWVIAGLISLYLLVAGLHLASGRGRRPSFP